MTAASRPCCPAAPLFFSAAHPRPPRLPPRSQGGGDRDGLPTLRRLAALFAERGLPLPPVVVLSGEGSPAAAEAFAAAGAARVLRKPATLDALKLLLQLVPGGGGGGAAAAGGSGGAVGVA